MLKHQDMIEAAIPHFIRAIVAFAMKSRTVVQSPVIARDAGLISPFLTKDKKNQFYTTEKENQMVNIDIKNCIFKLT